MRDRLGAPGRDGPEAAATLRDEALRGLTGFLIAVEAPRRDPRLLKGHVEALFRRLAGTIAADEPAAGGEAGAERRRAAAAEALLALEDAFPTLLQAEAAALLAAAAGEAGAPGGAPGRPAARLALAAVANACALLEAQRDGGAWPPPAGRAALVAKSGAPRGGEEEPDTPVTTLAPPRSEAGSSSTTTSPGSARSGGGVGGLSAALDAAAAASASGSASSSSSALAGAVAVDDGAPVPLLPPPNARDSLRRFRVPAHLRGAAAPPALEPTPACRAALQRGVRLLLAALPALSAAQAAAAAARLPPALRAAAFAPGALAPELRRMLAARSPALLRAALDLHAAAPEPFEGAAGAAGLADAVLDLVADAGAGEELRSTALAWALRAHAAQRAAGAPLALADRWRRLLPAPREPPALVALKVKALAACLDDGVADAGAVCRAVAGWEGWAAPAARGARARAAPRAAAAAAAAAAAPSPQQQRALAYALRLLLGGGGGPGAARRAACLAAAALGALAARPRLAPAVAAFLDTAPPAFAAAFLRALDALLAGVDGQFEALRARPEDAPFAARASAAAGAAADLASRVSAAVLARASSLSGMMRGLSMQLSFSGAAVPPSPRARPAGDFSAAQSFSLGGRRAVDLAALRASVSTAFRGSDDEGGSSCGASEAGESAAGPPAPEAPDAPRGLEDWRAAAAWLAAPATWEALAPALLQHDLLALRPLLARVVRAADAPPAGALAALASYAWQYKEARPDHALPSAGAAGAAVLALCHAAALAHLPWPAPAGSVSGGAGVAGAYAEPVAAGGDGTGGEPGWAPAAAEAAEALRGVADAVTDEGFPASASLRARARQLAALAADEGAWGPAARAATLAALLDGWVDAALE